MSPYSDNHNDISNESHHPSHGYSDLAAIPLSPSEASHPFLPGPGPGPSSARGSQHHHQLQNHHYSQPGPSSPRARRHPSLSLSPSLPPPLPRPQAQTRPSFLDELLPTPSSQSESYSKEMHGLPHSRTPRRSGSAGSHVGDFPRVVRRSGSVGVILVFILVATWLAATDTGGEVRRGLREVLQAGKGVLEMSPGQTGLGMGTSMGVGAGSGTHEDGDADAEGKVEGEGQSHGDGHGQEQDSHGHGHGSLPLGKNGKPDYDQYIMLRTIPDDMVSLSEQGRRVIIVGDIHGSYDPLQRLLRNLRYASRTDTLLHVGDLVAKGSHPSDVLDFMAANNVLGVRGNHDQPVVRWRAWMMWAGGLGWERMMDEVERQDEKEVRAWFERKGREWPEGWEWRGEHWKIARSLTTRQYQYLLSLPLALHMPSLHATVVHAGLVPYDLKLSPNDPSQPLVIADRAARSVDTTDSPSSSPNDDGSSRHARADASRPAGPARAPTRRDDVRTNEELSILTSLKLNTDAYTLTEMRSLWRKGKKRGRVTKSSKKGEPWADVWADEMGRCLGDGAGWMVEDVQEEMLGGGMHGHVHGEGPHVAGVVRRDGDEDEGGDEEEDGEEDAEDEDGDGTETDVDAEGKKGKGLMCSPFTVIYGHAAGRGLDIKSFSKGIDTGCVYGQKLTALVLGDTTGLKGRKVRVDKHKGLLVDVKCEGGGK